MSSPGSPAVLWARRLPRGRKLALVAAISVILIGTYFVILFPGTPAYPEPTSDMDPRMRAQLLAVRAHYLESGPYGPLATVAWSR